MKDKKENRQYEEIDLPFYHSEIAPILPKEVLDFHTHTWISSSWKQQALQGKVKGGKYMVMTKDYDIESLIEDRKRLFPDRPYKCVCFGQPTPAVDLKKTNEYTAKAALDKLLYPLIITGRDLIPADELEQAVIQEGFWGYKVFLNWCGDDYGSITIEDMIGPNEMNLADKLNLVVLLHVPRSGRLADPLIQKGVQQLSKDYPNAQIVLAHCGRCYCPDEMKQAAKSVAKLENVFLDTSMVMDPTVIEILLNNIDSKRLLFATDLPFANMRGRRVYVMDHWVDLVLEGYPQSAYRVCSDNMRATFMVYEIIIAIRRAAERTGLSKNQLSSIFYENGASILRKVRTGNKNRI